MPRNFYWNFIIVEPDAEKQEILIAQLSDFGFNGFEQTNQSLIASAPVTDIDDLAVQEWLRTQTLDFEAERLEEQNWNAQWEQSFEPVVVDKFCIIRAAFHNPIKDIKYDIIVTPKMSFGTGHHATTYMMLEAMQHIDFNGKTVIDFGSGTGILAILAEKSGAEKVDAIDYDDWCIENGTENIAANHCHHINMIKASGLEGISPADIILANINKHVILSSLSTVKSKLRKNGVLLISGLLLTDESEILQAALQNGFNMSNITERSGWLCICFGLSK